MPYSTDPTTGAQVWEGSVLPAATQRTIRATLADHETRIDTLEADEDFVIDASLNVIIGGGLSAVTTGASNIVAGAGAADSLETGSHNIVIGDDALSSITSGSDNTVIGEDCYAAATTAAFNTAVGDSVAPTVVEVTNSVHIGRNITAGDSAVDNEIVIGADATGAGSNTVTIGNASITDTILKGAVTATSFSTGTGVAPMMLVAAPASANSTGTAGNIAYDSSYFYVCFATNLWKRTAISSGW